MNELDKKVLDPANRWDARLIRLRRANRRKKAHAALRLLAQAAASPGDESETIRWQTAIAAAYRLNLSTGTGSAFDEWAADQAARLDAEMVEAECRADAEMLVVLAARHSAPEVDDPPVVRIEDRDRTCCPARDYAEWRRRP